MPGHINADVAKRFDGTNQIDFGVQPIVDTIGPGAKMMADNYAQMFSIAEHSSQQ